jgi:N-methylhydantoinase B
VLADVRDGKVTPEGAERDYGVRVAGSPWRVDGEATTRLRAARNAGPSREIAP